MRVRKLHKRKRIKAWVYPSAIEREYVKYLTSISHNITSEVQNRLDSLKPYFNNAIRQDSFSDLFSQWLEELLAAVLFFVDENQIKIFVSDFLQQTNNFNKAQLHRILKKAYGVNIFINEPHLVEVLKMFELENLKLIKSIPTQYVDRLRFKIIEAVRKGTRWENLAKDIQESFNIPKSRAELIARDQIGKLNGQLTKIRQQRLGITHYIWRGMLDERERELHVEREGVMFAWDNPPSDGHPGEPIRCRCYAEAVLPEIDEILKNENVIGVT